MRIRVASAADVGDLFRVRTNVRENRMSLAELAERGVTPETLSSMLVGHGRGWVMEREGRIVAFVMADAGDATIFALFVEPAFEGQGIGRTLIAEAEHWLTGKGCSQIWLETDSNPTVRANGFYRHLGWRESGTRPDGQTKFIKRLS